MDRIRLERFQLNAGQNELIRHLDWLGQVGPKVNVSYTQRFGEGQCLGLE